MKYLKDYPPDYAKPLELCLQMFNLCNIKLIDDGNSTLKNNWKYVILIPWLILHYASIVNFTLAVFTEDKEVVDIAVTVPVYILMTEAIFKMTITMFNKKKIRFIIEQLGNMWRTDNLNDVQVEKKKKLLNRLNRWLSVFLFTTYFGFVCYTLSPLAEFMFRSFILEQDCELLLPYPTRYPFDPTSNWFVYLALYVFQTMAMIWYTTSYLATDFIVAVFCSHLVTELALLREDLHRIVGAKNDKMNSEITEVVKKHQTILKLCKQLDEVFNPINFIVLVFVTVIMCFFAFNIKIANDLRNKIINFTVLVTIQVPLFILCYYSEQLASESAAIAKSAYNNLWYKGNVKYQKYILLIIIRAQKPCYLTSMKYAPITLNTFSKVITTTWSYFSLMTSVYEE